MESNKPNEVPSVKGRKWKNIILTVIAIIVILIIGFLIISSLKNAYDNKTASDTKKEGYATIAPVTDNQQLKYQSDDIYNLVDSINRVQETGNY